MRFPSAAQFVFRFSVLSRMHLFSEVSVQSLHDAVRTVPDFPQPGIAFKDVTPILLDPVLFRQAVEALAAPFRDAGVTRVAGIEARGFLFGLSLAQELDVGFVPIRKQGKLPWRTYRMEYDLEYGTDCMEMHMDAVVEGDRVLIHDDVIATGGTAAAAAKLIREAGGELVGFSFLAELNYLSGRDRLEDNSMIGSVLRFDG